MFYLSVGLLRQGLELLQGRELLQAWVSHFTVWFETSMTDMPLVATTASEMFLGRFDAAPTEEPVCSKTLHRSVQLLLPMTRLVFTGS
jgi:hypothetical protein